MKAVILTALAIILLVVVVIGAERLGYLAPSQEPQAYNARLMIADEIVSRRFDEAYGPSSNGAGVMAESIASLERQHPEIIASNRAEVRRIYDAWRARSGGFQREASAHFFARNFTISALEQIRSGGRPKFPDFRASVVWLMRRSELQLIADRTGFYSTCLLFVDVLPALGRLGVPKGNDFEEQKGNCELLIAAGIFEPKNAILTPTDLAQ